MSKPVSTERATATAIFRVSIHNGAAQIERYEDGDWHRIHFGPIGDLVALADCIDAAIDLSAPKARARS